MLQTDSLEVSDAHHLRPSSMYRPVSLLKLGELHPLRPKGQIPAASVGVRSAMKP